MIVRNPALRHCFRALTDELVRKTESPSKACGIWRASCSSAAASPLRDVPVDSFLVRRSLRPLLAATPYTSVHQDAFMLHASIGSRQRRTRWLAFGNYTTTTCVRMYINLRICGRRTTLGPPNESTPLSPRPHLIGFKLSANAKANDSRRYNYSKRQRWGDLYSVCRPYRKERSGTDFSIATHRHGPITCWQTAIVRELLLNKLPVYCRIQCKRKSNAVPRQSPRIILPAKRHASLTRLNVRASAGRSIRRIE